MTHFLMLCYNVFILENKIDAPIFRKICVNVLYHVGNCISLCQFGKSFLLVNAKLGEPLSFYPKTDATLELIMSMLENKLLYT
jgi:hypothetical protein